MVWTLLFEISTIAFCGSCRSKQGLKTTPAWVFDSDSDAAFKDFKGLMMNIDDINMDNFFFELLNARGVPSRPARTTLLA